MASFRMYLFIHGICLNFLLCVITVSAGCTAGQYGLDCKYVCHCNSGCDDVTGCSNTNCNKGWSGPKCTIENVALNKATYQTGESKNSYLAVDGIYTQGNWGLLCIITPVRDPFSWWEVDLGKQYYIHQLDIHFRTGFTCRRNDVHVYSSLKMNQTNTSHLCGVTTINSTDVTRVTCNNTAQYITLYQGTNNDIYGWNCGKAMDFCEVEVFVCDTGTFREKCTKFCHCKENTCHYVTGECTGGCQQNWTGTHCDVCDSSHYGVLCGSHCSSRHCDQTSGTSSCDSVTGKCDNGCEPGWRGSDCTQKCQDGTYGQNCKFVCSARHCHKSSLCDHVTGKCPRGCDRGYQSHDCTVACSGTYGYNCNTSCDARNCSGDSSCDIFYGRCTNGCLGGYKSPDCINECESGRFGPGCKLHCSQRHCSGDSSVCDVKTGKCENGCKPGWRNVNCLEPCPAGSYGNGCKFACAGRHCLNKTASCDHVTGPCGGGCEEPWTGTDCAGCQGKYGPDCKFSCSERHCKDTSAPCDHVTGSCDGECEDGWKGCTCTEKISKNAEYEELKSTITALSVVTGILCVLLLAAVIVLILYLKRDRTTSDSRAKENISIRNQDGGHCDIVEGKTREEPGHGHNDQTSSRDTTQQQSDGGYVNAGQEIRTNEYERLDTETAKQNLYEKISSRV